MASRRSSSDSVATFEGPKQPPFEPAYVAQEIPEEDDPKFQDWITRPPITPLIRPYRPTDAELITSPTDPNAKSYSSFGDSGTTATVNAYGELVQITRYLGPGRSGLFTLEHASLFEPYLVIGRAGQLQDISVGRTRGFGLQLHDRYGAPEKTKLEFVHDRWPRISYKILNKESELGDGDKEDQPQPEPPKEEEEKQEDTQAKNVSITVQLIAQEGFVMQQYVVSNDSDHDLDLVFISESLVRELDYEDSGHLFNDTGFVPETYSMSTSPNNYGMILSHKKPDFDEHWSTEFAEAESEEDPRRRSMNEGQNPEVAKPAHNEDLDNSGEPNKPQPHRLEAVGAIMAIFIDGVSKKFENGTKDEVVLKVPAKKSTELIAAFKLILMPASPAKSWKSLVVSAFDVDVDRLLSSQPPWAAKKNLFSKDARIDFMMRRNLEHILSVCTIPVGLGLIWDEKPESTSPAAATSIALTCGDISGHRVSISGSFFAFQLLLSALDYLNTREVVDTGEKLLKERIINTCKCHLDWVFKIAKTKKGRFDINYWVTGDCIASGTYLPANTPVNTPFQIIKAYEFSKRLSEFQGKPINIRELIQSHVQAWIKTFNKSGKTRVAAWRHSADTNIGFYRLDDHIWIWRALKCIDELWNSSNLKAQLWGVEQADIDLRKTYTPAEVQRQILKRFTTENDISKKRVFSVTRSARESRFLFHSRDTVLMYGYEGKFFDPAPGVWENTAEEQRYQEENQEMLWKNPLRYGLAITMGRNDYSISQRFSSGETRNRAEEALFLSSLPNGIFPGQIDDSSKEAQLFEEEIFRDFYFHVGFELPCILWDSKAVKTGQNTSQPGKETAPEMPPIGNASRRNSRHVLEVTIPALVSEGLNIPNNSQSLRVSDSSVPSSPTRQFSGDAEFQRQLQHRVQAVDTTAPKYNTQQLQATREAPMTKKHIPFNNLIDSRNIIDISDEWLYNYPEFLDVKSDVLGDIEKMEIKDGEDATNAKRSKIKEFMATVSFNERGRPVGRGAESYKNVPVTDDAIWAFTADSPTGCVVDIPRSKRVGKGKQLDSTEEFFYDNHELWDHLCEHRSADKAKKRFIWLPLANEESALICYLSSPESERESISLFFDRHANFDKYFFDDTAALSNTWETEVHLSFYQLLTLEQASINEKSKSDKLWKYMPPESPELFPDIQKKKIVRASVGFRFVGDFFDRYWTCHFIEYNPHSPELAGNFSWRWSPMFTIPYHSEREQGNWRQRKVLELVLFESMLKKIDACTKEILEAIKLRLGVEANSVLSYATLKSEDYFSSTTQWQESIQLLQALEDDFKLILEIVNNWENREVDRGQEKPRWTKYDERKYRRAINKHSGIINRKIRELKGQQAAIQSLSNYIKTTQDSMRNEISLRGSENIKFFTYVTVVFLPLGFAVSIFSMADEGPGHRILISMVVTAVIALLITVMALLNAQTFVKASRKATRKLNESAWERMNKSFIMAWHNKESKLATESAMEHSPRNRIKKSNKIKRSWLVWFWLVYILLEVPARYIIVGYRSVFRPSKQARESDNMNVDPTKGEDRILRESRETARRSYRVDPESEEATKKRQQQNNTRLVPLPFRILRVCAALALLPIYIMSFSIQLICLNLKDLWMLVQGKSKTLIEKIGELFSDDLADDKFEELLRFLTNPSRYRPLNISQEKGIVTVPDVVVTEPEGKNGDAQKPASLDRKTTSQGILSNVDSKAEDSKPWYRALIHRRHQGQNGAASKLPV